MPTTKKEQKKNCCISEPGRQDFQNISKNYCVHLQSYCQMTNGKS